MALTAYGTGRNTLGITEYIERYLNGLHRQMALDTFTSLLTAPGWVGLADDAVLAQVGGLPEWPQTGFAIEEDHTLDVGSLSVYHITHLYLFGTTAADPAECTIATLWGQFETEVHGLLIETDLPYNATIHRAADQDVLCDEVIGDWTIGIRDMWALCYRAPLMNAERYEGQPEFCIALLPVPDGETWTRQEAMGLLLDGVGINNGAIKNEVADAAMGPWAFLRGF